MPTDHDLYNELSCYTIAHGDAAFIHQHIVDAFIAQTADESTKPISLTFALVGLYLHVERQFTGRQVQLAHMKLAQDRGAITVTDVMAAPAGMKATD